MMFKKLFIFLVVFLSIFSCAFIFVACDEEDISEYVDLVGSGQTASKTSENENITTIHDITISEEIENGFVMTDKVSASAGETVYVFLNPNEGYILSKNSLKYNDTIIENYSSFIMPDEDVVINVEFVDVNSVLFSVSGCDVYDGKITPSVTEAHYGDTVTFTAEAYNGYKITGFRVDGVEVEGNSFTMPAHDVVLGFISERITYTIHFNNEEIEDKNCYYGNYFYLNNELTKDGYYFDGWYYDDEYKTKVETTYVIQGLETINLYSKFIEDPYTDGLVFEKTQYIENVHYLVDGYKVKEYNGSASEVVIPKTYLNLPVAEIGENAFKNAVITSISLTSNIKTINANAFESCSELTAVNFGENSTLTEIGNNAFKYCQKLSDITIPNSVTKIGEYAFSNCINLTNIQFQNESSLTDILKDAFQYCLELETITLPNSVSYIGNYAFAYDSKLKTVNLSDSLYKIGSYAFYGCAITSVDLPNNLVVIDDFAFRSCENLESVTIPSSVEAIYKNPFTGCTKLESIIVDKENKKFTSPEGSNALIGLSGTNILISACKNTVIPEDITYLTIGEHAFSFLSMDEFVLPLNVRRIDDYAFNGCTNLKKVLILKTYINKIGDYAFANCTSLENIYYMGSEDDFNGINLGTNYLWQTPAKITYYNFTGTYKGENGKISTGGNALNSGVVVWPSLKQLYFVGESLTSYDNAKIYFYGNCYDITGDMVGFNTEIPTDNLLSNKRNMTIYLEEFNIEFYIPYSVTTERDYIIERVKNEVDDCNNMYSKKVSSIDYATTIEILDNKNQKYFKTYSLNYLNDPASNQAPVGTTWILKEPFGSYEYTMYRVYSDYIKKSGYYKLESLYRVPENLTYKDYENGNFTFEDSSGMLTIENWKPSIYLSYGYYDYDSTVTATITFYYNVEDTIPCVPNQNSYIEVDDVVIN